MIRVQQLSKLYGDRLVLDVPEHTFEAERIHVLAGHNGSGKTTLMRIINGLDAPTSGVAETDVDACDMVFCAQKPYMFSTTVQRNVEYGLRVRGAADASQQASAMLQRLGLSHLAGERARTLSGGEMQRVALARTLVLKPKLLLLDEPFANLDEDSRRLVEGCLLEQHGDGATIIIATHLLEQVYRLTADVTRMKNGHILPLRSMNVFTGTVIHDGDHTEMKINDKLRIAVATEHKGQGRGILPPEDVVLSLEPIKSSMRNCFEGTLTSVARDGEHVDVVVDVGIDLTARITPESASEMDLEEGDSLYAAFKATAVKVY